MIHTLLDSHQSTSAAQVLFNQKKKREKENPRWLLRFITGMENAAPQLLRPTQLIKKYGKRNKNSTKAGRTPALPPTVVCGGLWNIYIYLDFIVTPGWPAASKAAPS